LRRATNNRIQVAPEGPPADCPRDTRGLPSDDRQVDDVVGISGFIMPERSSSRRGHRSGDKSTQDPISKIVLQKSGAGQRTEYRQAENQRDANSVKAVTLQVTPEQAEKLALASSEGKLQLVMRNSTDQGDEKLAA